MWVSMLELISGGRADGSQWPDKGVPFEVSDTEGERLIRGQLARKAGPPQSAKSAFKVTSPPVPPPPLPVPEWAKPVAQVAAEQAAPSAAAKAAVAPAAAAAQVAQKQADQKQAEAPETVSRPSPSDPKQAWVDYAVSQGTSVAEASGQSKVQLQAAFGGRL